MLRSELKISIRFTLITVVLLGVLYPLAVTAIGQLAFRRQADGQLLIRNNQLIGSSIIGSSIIGQAFSSDRYFDSRPSAAGNGYDATASGGSNYAASNQKLLTRIAGDVARYAATGDGQPVPIDLVTASASGLDSDISPAAALYQVSRVARVRHLSEDAVRNLVLRQIQGRQFGVLGEPRVNVLELNLALDGMTH